MFVRNVCVLSGRLSRFYLSTVTRYVTTAGGCFPVPLDVPTERLLMDGRLCYILLSQRVDSLDITILLSSHWEMDVCQLFKPFVIVICMSCGCFSMLPLNFIYFMWLLSMYFCLDVCPLIS